VLPLWVTTIGETQESTQCLRTRIRDCDGSEGLDTELALPNHKPDRIAAALAVAEVAGEVKHYMGILRMAHLASAWLTARMNLKSERGATAVEYGIMVALIAAVIILAVVFLGQRTSTTFSCSAQAISTKGSVASC